MAGQITYTQQRLESLLVANVYFDDIAVIPFDKGDIQNMVDIAVAKIGIAVVIMAPRKETKEQDAPGPFSKIFCSCEVIETVVVNRGVSGTNKPASEVAEYIESIVHCSQQPDDNMFVHMSSALTGMGKNDRNETQITWAVDFFTYGGVQLDITRAATPTISDNGSGNITLACTTPGVAIRYTVNGKNPSVAANLYTAPFSILSGTTVKARAWNWGYTISQAATYTR